MKAIDFPESNTVFAKDQEEYISLPAYVESNTVERGAVTCYKLTLFERLKVLLTGKIWFTQLTFNNQLQPQRPSVHKWDALDKKYFDELNKNSNDTNC